MTEPDEAHHGVNSWDAFGNHDKGVACVSEPAPPRQMRGAHALPPEKSADRPGTVDETVFKFPHLLGEDRLTSVRQADAFTYLLSFRQRRCRRYFFPEAIRSLVFATPAVPAWQGLLGLGRGLRGPDEEHTLDWRQL